MTCIVAVRDEDGRIVMGADSSASGNGDCHTSTLQKVFQVGPFLIGYTDSFRMGQLLQYKLDVPEETIGNDLEYMATAFIDAVMDIFRRNAFTRTDSSQESGGTFMVAYRGELYVIESDFQVNKYTYDYYAVGSGAAYAMGSLYSTQGRDTASQRAYEALGAAARFSSSVSSPFGTLKEKEWITE